MKVLLAGDQFVTNQVLEEALTQKLPQVKIAKISSSWPVPPFQDVAEVKEALGDEDELIAALKGCEVAFSHTFPFTEKVISASPDLRLITICRGGPVNVNIEAATRHGVMVSYTPGRNAIATSEHTVGMIYAALRQIPQRHLELVNGKWRSDYYKFENVGPELACSTVGLVGYGAVGKLVAKTLLATGAKIVVYDPWADTADAPEELEFVDSPAQLFEVSNIVSIHARATADNHHMVDAKILALMPEGGIIVNCARGSLVDYDAVCDALDSNHLYAAAFDALPLEPLPLDHRLLKTERVTLTPHLGGASQDSARLAARIGTEDIVRFSEQKAPLHLSNPEVLAQKKKS